MSRQTDIKIARKPLPLWSRLLVVLVSFMFFSSIYGVVMGTVAFKRAFENCQETAHIKQVAQRILKFPAPLPEGYKYSLGVDLDFFTANIKFVGIDYKEGKQQLLFVALNSVNPERSTRVMLQSAYDIGVNTPGVSGRFTETLSRGRWTFEGSSMPYIIGKLKDIDDKEHVGLVACMLMPEKKKTLFLYAVEPGEKEKFDINVCVDLLKEIRGF